MDMGRGERFIHKLLIKTDVIYGVYKRASHVRHVHQTISGNLNLFLSIISRYTHSPPKTRKYLAESERPYILLCLSIDIRLLTKRLPGLEEQSLIIFDGTKWPLCADVPLQPYSLNYLTRTILNSNTPMNDAHGI